ncbi:MAG: DUF3127 domain-containing protein [Prolixibacteraceae bacterium]|nr:DUF3127 domain-containing protein [Prolixibacteraceae bacterium]
MALSVKGKLVKILKEETGVSRAGNAWKKQDFIIETNDQYPKKICFTLFNDKVNLIEGLPEGTEIDVSFDVESREFNGKYYHNLNAWKIDRQSQDVGFSPPPFGIDDIPQEPLEPQPDDLPF